MTSYVPTRCYEFVRDDKHHFNTQSEQSITQFRNESAYVLLGRPGSGKTTAFKREAEAKEPQCVYISARDFITFDIQEEWRNKTLFIDGLDEIRAGTHDNRGPLDSIRRKLDQLGRPPFRISCREADWYGASDREDLATISPDKKIKELFLAKLSDEDVEQILSGNFKNQISDPEVFLDQAKKYDLLELIKNPQILKMLVSAVGNGGDWPKTKSETFELACKKLLLIEQNRNHIHANRTLKITIEKLMQASGSLCTLLLLAGKYGFSQSQPESNDEYPFIEEMDIDQSELLSLVTNTELFSTKKGRIEYSHRIFAEYLSGYYLAEKIKTTRVPMGRVLALMTGDDGLVVTELRGVYAWLTTLYHKERTMLIKRDPLGIVLYGDVGLFNKEEQWDLLNELSINAEKSDDFGIEYWNAQSFSPFSNKNLETDFQMIFDSSDRSRTRQLLLAYILTSMRHGNHLPGLSDALTNVIHDTTWWPDNREDALDILIRLNDKNILDKILNDINTNVIDDRKDDLLGSLLESLYPDRISPSEIFDYLHFPENPDYMGRYVFFWIHNLVEKSEDRHIPELLNALVDRQETLRHSLNEIHYRTMISILLSKGLDIFGEHIEVRLLSEWLALGLDENGFVSFRNGKELKAICTWFKEHPEIQRKLINHQLDKCRESEHLDRCMHILTERWFHGELPEDYGLWCLDKAKTAESEDEAYYLFMQCIRTFDTGRGNLGLTLELLLDSVSKDQKLSGYWEEARVCNIDNRESEYRSKDKKRMEKQRQEKTEYLKYFRKNLSDIREGTASPGIFNDIGSAYYDYLTDAKGDSPVERMEIFFENDAQLIKDVLAGLRHFLNRDDIPDVTTIIDTNINNRYLYYSRPYRAALDELSQEDSESILQLSTDKINKAIAFYLADGSGYETVWYRTLLKKEPGKIAKIYVKYVRMSLRAGKEHIPGIYNLAYDEKYKEVACLVTIPILEAMPARIHSGQMEMLGYLLKSAVRYADNHLQFQELLNKKISQKSMTITQNVYWLAAGFILDPGNYSDMLSNFVARNKSRIECLCDFLFYRSDQWPVEDHLSIKALAQLILLSGPYYAPYRFRDEDGNTHRSSMRPSALITDYINKIATNSTDEATAFLEKLQLNESLSKWKSSIENALYRQGKVKRESNFRHAGIEHICNTLKNQAPANAADLASLTVEHIRDLADNIKHNPTSDYRQYWSGDKNKNLLKRKHEEDCRDAFLSDLKSSLGRLDISAHAESQYVNDKRADIRVSYGGSNGYEIPVEVKCNDSRDLWYAMHDQLIKLYSHDPEAKGYGIYLVFWFGNQYTTPYKEGGAKPKTAVELEKRLSMLLVSDEERNKITVCVIDCSDQKESESRNIS